MNKKTRVGIFGAGGRVGLELLYLIKESEELIAECGVGYQSHGFNNNAKEVSDLKSDCADIFIDFSSPDLFEKALQFCAENGIPMVSGTTGLKEDHFQAMKAASKKIPLLWSPNMSLGIAVMKKALSVFQATKNFDFQVEEWHHRNKKDRPSGTAIYLQNELERVIEKKCPEPLVIRAGGIYGVHKVYAISDEEIIQFEHTATNRTVFARGAITACQWLINKKSGFYSMDDVIS